MLHRARLGHDVRLEKRERHEHHATAFLRDEIRDRRITAHQRHLAEGLAWSEVPERLPFAVLPRNGSRDLPFDHDPEEMQLVARVNDNLARSEEDYPRAICHLFTVSIGKVREQRDVGFEECEVGGIHDRGTRWLLSLCDIVDEVWRLNRTRQESAGEVSRFETVAKGLKLMKEIVSARGINRRERCHKKAPRSRISGHRSVRVVDLELGSWKQARNPPGKANHKAGGQTQPVAALE